MGRVTKWIGIGFLGLIGLLVIAVVIVYALTSRRMSKTYAVNDPPLAIPTDSASIANTHGFCGSNTCCDW